jgi:hypothetical protein
MDRREVLHRLTGDRRDLAVECLIFPVKARPKFEWMGSVWLWVGGRVLGGPCAEEMLVIGLDALGEVAAETGHREQDLLGNATPEEALAAVQWARYGDDEPQLLQRFPNRESLEIYEVFPRRAGPFFEGWQACLLEHGGRERLVWKEREWPRTWERTFSIGQFKSVVEEMRRWYDEI